MTDSDVELSNTRGLVIEIGKEKIMQSQETLQSMVQRCANLRTELIELEKGAKDLWELIHRTRLMQELNSGLSM